MGAARLVTGPSIAIWARVVVPEIRLPVATGEERARPIDIDAWQRRVRMPVLRRTGRTEDRFMHAVIRHYRANAELADALVKRSGEVEELIRGVDGFVAYYLVKTSEGTATISVFEDQAGTQESTRRAAAFVKENLASIAGEPPEVIEGETAIHFAR